MPVHSSAQHTRRTWQENQKRPDDLTDATLTAIQER